MSNLSSFVKFISDDPIMLGLCIAIIVLVVAFILVLILGRKKEDKKEVEIDNTTELLKTEVNLEALKSTQEYNLSEFQGASENPIEETKEEVPAPIIEEPLVTNDLNTSDVSLQPVEPQVEPQIVPQLENSTNDSSNLNDTFMNQSAIPSEEVFSENSIPDTSNIETSVPNAPVLETPSYEEPVFGGFPKFDFEPEVTEIPVVIDEPIPAKVEFMDTNAPANDFSDFNQEKNDVQNDEPEALEDTQDKEELKETATLDEESISPIIESVVSPIEEEQTLEEQPEESKEEQLETNSIVEEPSKNYFNAQEVELPTMNTGEFNRSAIINEFKNEETPKTEPEKNNFDDLDLPKLNTNNTNTVTSIQGESFNIN